MVSTKRARKSLNPRLLLNRTFEHLTRSSKDLKKLFISAKSVILILT